MNTLLGTFALAVRLAPSKAADAVSTVSTPAAYLPLMPIAVTLCSGVNGTRPSFTWNVALMAGRARAPVAVT